MAESDTRLETLEDEVKVLKGEVKRTLVDLRALLMREDSPLGDGALSRRMAMPERGMEASGTAGPKAAGPGTEAAPGLTSFPSSPPQAGPGAFPGAASPPIVIQQGGPPPGPQPAADPAALAEQERCLAEQERRMAEQERKLAQQERDLTNASPPGQPEPPHNEYRHSPEEGEKGGYQPAENASQVTLGWPEHRENSQEDPGTGQAAPLVSQNGWKDLAEERPVAGPQDKKDAEQPPGSRDQNERNQRANSVYDEYQELLEESKEVYPNEDAPAGPPLDINLLSSLVDWVALAKQRVGEQQLKDIVELYIKSGHSRPELRDLLLHVSNLVDAAPVTVRQSDGEWMDLMFHLHGILTGGFPVVKIPQMKLLSGQSDSDEESF